MILPGEGARDFIRALFLLHIAFREIGVARGKGARLSKPGANSTSSCDVSIGITIITRQLSRITSYKKRENSLSADSMVQVHAS